MSETTNQVIIKGKLIHKHDTEANWNKANNFYPLFGEIIVYDPDENYPYPRYKTGIWDGKSTKTDAMLVKNLPFSNNPVFEPADPAIIAVGRDAEGHVKLGGELIVQSGGGGEHNHTTNVTAEANTFVTSVSPTSKKISLSPSKTAVLTEVKGAYENLDVIQITPVSGSVTASKATAGTAKDVAKTGTATRYGTANVGTTVTGLAKRASSARSIGNANIATSATIIGNADVGTAVRYGTADVGTAITVQDGKADVGTAVRYGTANVGTAVSVAKQATSQTLVGNADVGTAVVYGTANAGTPITFTVGTADVGTQVTGLAKRSSAQTTVGNANVGTGTTVASGSVTSVTAPVISVKVNSTAKDAYNAEYDSTNECLILSPVTITAAAPTVTLGTKTIKEAVASETKIYSVTSDQVSILPAKAATGTQTITPAVTSTTTLTPAKSVSSNSTKIYGVSESINITPAVAAPSTQTLTPAVASGRTKSIAPAVSAPSTQTLTPAKAATSTIYGAVASTDTIYGVTADQVTVTSATEAPSTQTIIPAVANGTITPWTFADVTVPKAATAVTVATGSLSVGGSGEAVMTGPGEVVTADVLTGATIVAGTNGDTTVVTAISAPKNTKTTFSGNTGTHTELPHTHTLVADERGGTTTYTMRALTPSVSTGSDGVFEVEASAANVTGVEINGQTVDPSNYTVQN
jgi:hypothetical protein